MTTPSKYEPVKTTEVEEGQVIHAACSATAVNFSQTVSNLVSNLTWTDQYYQNEPDIIAVFDLDHKAIQLYQNKSASKFTWLATVWLILGMTYVLLNVMVLAYLFFFIFFVFLSLAVKTCKRSRYASNGGGLHMAITSSSIRYDQEDPFLTTEISLKSIATCTMTQKKMRRFPWSSETIVNLVMIQIVGANTPKTYVGLVNPEGFTRLVMSLKNYEPNHHQDASLIV